MAFYMPHKWGGLETEPKQDSDLVASDGRTVERTDTRKEPAQPTEDDSDGGFSSDG